WRTVVAVSCGLFGGTVDVLDVTDPLYPAWLWTGAVQSGGFTMGAASGGAFGLVQLNGVATSVLYLATKNAGSGGSGVNLYALDPYTGAVRWQWNRLYARHIPGTGTLVPNDLPGVPAVVNVAGDGGFDDRVVLGDLDGILWEV